MMTNRSSYGMQLLFLSCLGCKQTDLSGSSSWWNGWKVETPQEWQALIPLRVCLLAWHPTADRQKGGIVINGPWVDNLWSHWISDQACRASTHLPVAEEICLPQPTDNVMHRGTEEGVRTEGDKCIGGGVKKGRKCRGWWILRCKYKCINICFTVQFRMKTSVLLWILAVLTVDTFGTALYCTKWIHLYGFYYQQDMGDGGWRVLRWLQTDLYLLP